MQHGEIEKVGDIFNPQNWFLFEPVKPEELEKLQLLRYLFEEEEKKREKPSILVSSFYLFEDMNLSEEEQVQRQEIVWKSNSNYFKT